MGLFSKVLYLLIMDTQYHLRLNIFIIIINENTYLVGKDK